MLGSEGQESHFSFNGIDASGGAVHKVVASAGIGTGTRTSFTLGENGMSFPGRLPVGCEAQHEE